MGGWEWHANDAATVSCHGWLTLNMGVLTSTVWVAHMHAHTRMSWHMQMSKNQESRWERIQINIQLWCEFAKSNEIWMWCSAPTQVCSVGVVLSTGQEILSGGYHLQKPRETFLFILLDFKNERKTLELCNSLDNWLIQNSCGTKFHLLSLSLYHSHTPWDNGCHL